MTNKIIIAGNIAGCGKTTAAEYLVNKYGYTELFFASEIYNIARKLFEMKGKNRKLLQDIGEKMREIDPDVWTNYVMKQSEDILNKNKKVVVSDLRRFNEYVKAVQEGFLPIRIVCDRDVAIQRIIARDGKCDISLLDNDSENGTRNIPMLQIYNNGGVEELQECLDKLMQGDFTQYIKEKQLELITGQVCDKQ